MPVQQSKQYRRVHKTYAPERLSRRYHFLKRNAGCRVGLYFGTIEQSYNRPIR